MKAPFINTEGFFFVGIGGIGMSNLARYFKAGGFSVAGYDKTESPLTTSLENEGFNVIYEDNTDLLPSLFATPENRSRVIVVYTPAIPLSNSILTFFRSNNYRVEKRSAILGIISGGYETIAIAGTHGKTTISTITAHLLKQSSVDCSAFLGGIAKNYNSNLLLGAGRFAIMEADEYDRSFLQLHPAVAVISSMDADHLDIYGTHDAMIEAFSQFAGKIRKGGVLFVNSRVKDKLRLEEDITVFTYGIDEDCEYRPVNIDLEDGYHRFDILYPGGKVEGLRLPLPGIVNIENCTAAVAVALNSGVSAEEVRKALIYFKGVVRRFDIRYNDGDRSYIDDYAHHPEEIKAFVGSIRDFFPGKRITGIFQPHLYSRTRDHAAGFAESLDLLDEAILLPLYPAREEPIEGVGSEMIAERMKKKDVKIVERDKVLDIIDWNNIETIVTIGAGDIDRLADKIEQKMKER